MRTSTSSDDLFNLELKYNNPSSGTANYNGNISQMGYSYATSTAVNRTFTYTYDYLNRLTDAALASGTLLKETLSYDDLGNITSLARGGTGHGTLSYGYTNGQLTGVTGYATRSYAYDRNGNATSDGGTKMIGYNMLNLPDTVKVSNAVILKYYYDAAGQKLRSVSTADGTREYIGGIVYEGSDLRSISTAEGRITHNSGVFKYKYDLKDHLGNVRVTFDKNTSTGNAELVQADEYYSFGLRSGLYDNSNGNRYLYNGKERQADLEDQYDYGARFYDPVIARWTSVDPSAENYEHTSPYTYVLNNPINLGDLDGRDTIHLKEVLVHSVKPKPIQKPIVIDPEEVLKPNRPFPAPPAFVMPLLTVVFVLLPANYGQHAEADDLYRMNIRRYSKYGSYTIKFKNGKRYHGKGPYSRTLESANRIAKLEKTTYDVLDIDWTPAATIEQAFRDEAKRLEADGGKNNPNNYNQIDSPGSKKYKQE